MFGVLFFFPLMSAIQLQKFSENILNKYKIKSII